jgi:hypothetical protein
VPVTVAVHTVADTAGDGADFVGRQASLTIPQYSRSALFTVSTLGDTQAEPRESYRAVVDSVQGATVVDGEATGWIIDNEAPLLSISDAAIAEGDAGTKQLSFTVRLDRVSASPVTYDLATSDASTTAGSDYVPVALASQAIPAGQLARVHSITINADTTPEDTELLLVNLSHPSGAAILDGEGVGYLLNDDGPTLSLLDASVVEGNDGFMRMMVTARLSEPAAGPVTFELVSSAGTASQETNDWYGTYPEVYSIPAGQVSVTVPFVYVQSDRRVEANETIGIEMRRITGASKFDWIAQGTIVNDDGPTLSVQNTGVTESDGGTKVATFVVTLSQAATVPVSYSIRTVDGTATAGSDYVGRSLAGETIPAGMRSRTFAVTVNGDTAVEGTESFRANLTGATGATIFRPSAVGTITDND